MHDTLELTRKLERNGVHRKQAEAHVEVITNALSKFATKEDLQREIQLLENRMTVKMIKIQITVNSAFIGVFVVAKNASEWF